MSHRRIAHLDMDAFYASVELLRYPMLQGLPVVIGGSRDQHPQQISTGDWQFKRLRDYAGRGVITTCTYPARALGAHAGMGLMKAAQLAPDAVLLPVDFPAYRHYSRLFKRAVATICTQIEDRGIDEIYLDITDHPDETISLATQIKQAVQQATGLTCSICVAPNKLLAKIGSDLEKPNGLTVLTPDCLRTRIWPLSVRKVNGIGPKAAEKLAQLGIETIAQLAATDPGVLQEHFGCHYAGWLYEVAQGMDDRPVITQSEPKSISRETTFERDLHVRTDKTMLSSIFTELCTALAQDLQHKGYQSRTIGIKLRYENFQTVTRDWTLATPTDDAQTIRQIAGECLRRVPLQQKLRLLGVRASGLRTNRPSEHHGAHQQQELPL